MRKILLSIALGLIMVFTVSEEVDGQDLHYSQFYNSPLNLNPALTGIFNGDKRIIGSLRDQWRFVPVTWQTFSGSYDFKLIPKNSDTGFWGLGFTFNHDRQGASNLNLSTLNVSGSYSYLLNSNNVITGGLLLGFSSRGFSEDDLTWDNFWDGAQIDPSRTSGENFDAKRVSFLETGIGANYRWQQSARTNLNIGAGLFHFIRPSVSYYDGDSEKLPMRIALSGVGSFKVASPLDIQLHAMHQIQEEYRETVIGGLVKLHLSQRRGKETQLHLGLGYRTSGSLIPTIALEFTQWYASFSYDVDATDFNEIVDAKRGGPEFHIRYIITSVKPIKDFKSCPIF